MPSSLPGQSYVSILDRIIHLLLKLGVVEVFFNTVFGFNIQFDIGTVPEIEVSSDLRNAVDFYLDPLVREQLESTEIRHVDESRTVEFGDLVYGKLSHVFFVDNFDATKHVNKILFFTIKSIFFPLI